MKRIALYCRYSTDLQDETSIEDQTRLCQALAKRMGWTAPIDVYADLAISGASRHNRPEYQRMMRDLDAGVFDALLVENISRLTRDTEDSAHMMKRAKFHGVSIYPANDHGAPISPEMANFHAMMAEMARKQGAEMIHRSMSGLVLNGKSAGGKSYGYQSEARRPNERGGELEIVPHEAEIVREIFTRYIDGESPKSIATDLNKRGVPSPRARIERKNGTVISGLWRDSTINGNKDRETGILFNPLYAGIRKWNRTQHVKHPDTARRVSRINSQAEWCMTEAPELAIVAPDVWDAARARKQDRSFKQTTRHAQRAKRVFSGLMRCGSCGSTVNSNGRDTKTGKPRVKCDGSASMGICENPVRAYIEDIEGVILHALRKNLADAEMLDAYIDAYIDERKRLMRDSVNEHDTITKKLTVIEARIERLYQAYMNGVIEVEKFKTDSEPMKAEKAVLEGKLALVDEPASAISFHPTAVASFKEALGDLSTVLCSDGQKPSSQLIRSVIDRVIITPSAEKPASPFERRKLHVDIIGALDTLLTDHVVGKPICLAPVGEGSGSGGGT
jgi:site-specific DNA recombinase